MLSLINLFSYSEYNKQENNLGYIFHSQVQGFIINQVWKDHLEEVETIAYKPVSETHTTLFRFKVFFKKKKSS